MIEHVHVPACMYVRLHLQNHHIDIHKYAHYDVHTYVHTYTQVWFLTCRQQALDPEPLTPKPEALNHKLPKILPALSQSPDPTSSKHRSPNP